MQVFTEENVTLIVPQTVKGTHVTYRTECVSIVSLGGLKCIAIQV